MFGSSNFSSKVDDCCFMLETGKRIFSICMEDCYFKMTGVVVVSVVIVF